METRVNIKVTAGFGPSWAAEAAYPCGFSQRANVRPAILPDARAFLPTMMTESAAPEHCGAVKSSHFRTAIAIVEARGIDRINAGVQL